MNLLGILLAKDLRRARRNPLPYLVHLAVPLVITGLIGLVFGTGSETGLGRIRFAIVDEDDTPVSGFLRGATQQREGARYLEPVFLPRDEALREVTNNRLSAAVIIPPGFTRDYLSATAPVTLHLVKNPAQSFHPAILEELLDTLVTGLNAVSRNFGSDLAAWNRLLRNAERPDYPGIADQVVLTGQRIEAMRRQLFPPLVSYTKETREDESDATKRPAQSIFAFLLPGLAGMFLLFLADTAIRDLYREIRFRTFERFCTLPQRLFAFISAKVVFTLAILALAGVILFVGGSAIFRIQWPHPGALTVLVASYGLFAAGFMALLAAVTGGERVADVVNTLVAMAMGLAGGCMFAPEQLPSFVRVYLAPVLPTSWFVASARGLSSAGGPADWLVPALALAAVGVTCVAAAAWIFNRRLRQGVRP